jgi:peptidyl-prolyl cis-trans isomerase C
VASVNGTDLTLAEVLMAVSALPAQYQQLPPDVLFGAIVDQLIQQELLAQAATGEPATLAAALANQRRQVLANAAVGELVASALTPEALQAAYDAAFAEAEPQTEWRARHILVATEEEATAVKDRLAAGEDFAAIAQEVSTDAGSGAQGGELGWFSAGMMVPEFETAVAALQPGDVSEPVQSQFGWHVVELEETRDKPAPTLEEVRPDLEAQVQQEAVQARLAELEAAGEVTRPAPDAFDPALALDPRILQ